MTKVLHVITDLQMGGAERSLHRLLEASQQADAEHHVVSLRGSDPVGGYIRAVGIPVTAIGIQGAAGGVMGLRRLRDLMVRYRPDVIQGWMYHGCLAATMASAGLSHHARVIWCIRHSLTSLRPEKPLTRQVIRWCGMASEHADHIVWNSSRSRSQHEAMGFRGRAHHVVENGISLDACALEQSAAARARWSWGVPDGALVVGSVARFHPMKGHAALVSSLEPLVNRNVDLHLVLCGRGCEPSGPAWRLVAQSPALRQRTHFLGEVANPDAVYPGLDVFVTPSLWGESCPNALIEAMASGVPCVATDLGGSAEILEGCGDVVPPGDIERLSRAVHRVLRLPPQERRRAGELGRGRARARYDIARTARRYEHLWAGAAP
ncbi:MAG: glycosyltransferase [Phycisphaerales bacterium]|nr:glycosyltransferase [Phycisphaerales bacterium]